MKFIIFTCLLLSLQVFAEETPLENITQSFKGLEAGAHMRKVGPNSITTIALIPSQSLIACQGYQGMSLVLEQLSGEVKDQRVIRTVFASSFIDCNMDGKYDILATTSFKNEEKIQKMFEKALNHAVNSIKSGEMF